MTQVLELHPDWTCNYNAFLDSIIYNVSGILTDLTDKFVPSMDNITKLTQVKKCFKDGPHTNGGNHYLT